MTLLRFDFCYYIRYSGNHTTLVLKMSTSLWMSAAVFVVQVARPPSVCDVTSAQYGGGGASRDGKILATTAIQEAIEACATDGGGLVVFPGPGIYLSGALTLRSNVHIHVDPTATLLGSDNTAQYSPLSPLESYYPCDGIGAPFSPLLGGENVTNITITGGGTIDGGWLEHAHATGVRLIQFRNAHNVHLQNVTLQNSGLDHPFL
jgi:polygalacturonase